MLFSSITFLFAFLPIVLLLYFISPRVLKNTVLLLVSLVFYAWGEPRYVVVMICSILIGYIMGIFTEKFLNEEKKGLS
ncbi:MAG: MBOAT family protein, partial [Wujia sp.]